MSDKNENIKQKIEYGGYVSKLVFNNGEEIVINNNDIVIFVGPNNVGKSQALKDIYELCERKKSTTVIKNIEVVKYKNNILPLLTKISMISDMGSYQRYTGLGYDITTSSITTFSSDKYFEHLRPVFVSYLDTIKRLTITNPADLINRKMPKKDPIHYVAFDSKYRKWLSYNFKQAFGKEIIPFTANGSDIPLCIGDAVKFDKEFSDEQEREEEYSIILDSYPRVHEQGDGIKSFTGILLYLMVEHYCAFLIDEPESFLHPPQANIMGRIIGNTLQKNKQAFISTHSEEIIKGLLDVCPERLKIIRISRNDNENNFSILENAQFYKVWNDPLLKHSNIMQSLFHKNVVLCESDSDCKMYSIIENHIKETNGGYSETLFIHCGGKHRMAKVATALKALDVDVKLVADIDVLNDETILKGIVKAFGINWTSIANDYKILCANLHSDKEHIKRDEASAIIRTTLSSSSSPTLSKNEIDKIRNAVSTKSKWERLKTEGINAIPAGDATSSFNKIEKVLKEKGVHLVLVGELEYFIKEVGGHGPEWVNSVLEEYPNLQDEIYIKIIEFVKQIIAP